MTAAVQSAARWVHRAAAFLQYVGVAALIVMILLSAGDVIYRYFAGVGITASIQVNEMMMVAATFGALGAAQHHDKHVSVDFVISKIVPRAAGIVEGIALLVVALAIGFAAQSSWHIAIDAKRVGEVTIGIVDVPTWPSRFLVSIGLVVLTAELIVSGLQSICGSRASADEAHTSAEEITGGVR